MSSRLHNKWHRHNHHTNPTADINFPDSAHDPIASPESPFQGSFVLNGSLSASQSGQLAGNPALTLQGNNLALQANGEVVITGTTTIGQNTDNQLRVYTLRFLDSSKTFDSMTKTDNFLAIIIDGVTHYLPLWRRTLG